MWHPFYKYLCNAKGPYTSTSTDTPSVWNSHDNDDTTGPRDIYFFGYLPNTEKERKKFRHRREPHRISPTPPATLCNFFHTKMFIFHGFKSLDTWRHSRLMLDSHSPSATYFKKRKKYSFYRTNEKIRFKLDHDGRCTLSNASSVSFMHSFFRHLVF